jgi:hypothetical protein
MQQLRVSGGIGEHDPRGPLRMFVPEGARRIMHDFLIGLAFIGMVICPAVVATFSRGGMEDDQA